MKTTTQWKQLHNENNYIIKATTQWKQLHNKSNCKKFVKPRYAASLLID